MVAERVGPRRRCRCGAAADCVAAVEERSKLGRMGLRYDHRCAECGSAFSVHDLTNIAFMTVYAAVVTGFGGLIVVHPPGSAVGAESSNRWFGVGALGVAALGWAMVAARIRARWVHPDTEAIAR